MDLNFEVQESDEHAFKSFYDSLKEQHIPDLEKNISPSPVPLRQSDSKKSLKKSSTASLKQKTSTTESQHLKPLKSALTQSKSSLRSTKSLTKPVSKQPAETDASSSELDEDHDEDLLALKKQVKLLQVKNYQIVQELEQKTVECLELKRDLDAVTSDAAVEKTISESFNAAAQSDDFREQKLIDLAKKSRRLYVALERERSKNAGLNAKIRSAEMEAKLHAKPAVTTLTSPVSKDEVQGLKDKLALFMRKVEEERIQNQSLKAELRNAQKALIAEIGDEKVIPKILNGEVGWKGRAQQILALKDKVREMTWKMSQKEPTTAVHSEFPIINDHQSIAPTTHSRNESPMFADKSSILTKSSKRFISETEKRRIQREQEIIEVEKMRKEYQEMQRAFAAQKSRNSFLERNARDLKEKLRTLVEKTMVDDQLIDALKHELEKKEMQLSNGLQSSWDDKDDRIKELESVIKRLTDKHTHEMRTAPVEPINSREVSANSKRGMLNALQALKIRNEGLESLNRSLEARIRQLEDDRNDLALELKHERRAAQMKGTPAKERVDETEVSRLRAKIEIQEDEIQGLKSSIKSILKRKEEEMKVYNDMLSKTEHLLAQ